MCVCVGPTASQPVEVKFILSCHPSCPCVQCPESFVQHILLYPNIQRLRCISFNDCWLTYYHTTSVPPSAHLCTSVPPFHPPLASVPAYLPQFHSSLSAPSLHHTSLIHSMLVPAPHVPPSTVLRGLCGLCPSPLCSLLIHSTLSLSELRPPPSALRPLRSSHALCTVQYESSVHRHPRSISLARHLLPRFSSALFLRQLPIIQQI